MPCFRAALSVVALSIARGSPITSESALREILLQGYDKLMPPGMRLQPTTVEISTSLSSLYGINQQNGQFSVDMFFRGHWTDPRLAYKDLELELGYSLPRLDIRTASVWTPDIMVTNAVKTTQPPGEIMFYVDPNGHVTWSRRFIWECRCKMHFNKFPFDEQRCGIYFETYHERAEDVLFAFASSTDAGFSSIVSNQWEDFIDKRSAGVATYSTGIFPTATLSFTMRRRSTAWVFDGIGLSNIFVFISYCGLWIAKEAAPGRIALSIICVLIATSNYARISAAMPIVTYKVWMKDYLLGCVYFNLAVVVSYSIVNFGMQQKAKPTPRLGEEEEKEAPGFARRYVDLVFHGTHRVPGVHHVVYLEWHLRWFMPLAFLIFTIAMWTSIDSYDPQSS